MLRPILHIGNKNYSSWSLRGWLALKWSGIDFEEHVIPLGVEGYGKSKIAAVRAISPSGRVPALHLDAVVVHESLAVCEWAAEQTPSLWPADATTRALARTAASEMHAGFEALRRDLSMNLRLRLEREPDWPDDTRGDLTRLFEIWSSARERFAAYGPWLFGARSMADAMFAPVTTRLRTYHVAAPPAAQAYCETLFADPDFKIWERDALAEPWTIPQAERTYS